MKNAACHLLAFAMTAAASAGEVTVLAEPFRIERSFVATLLPTKAASLAVDPQVWNDFQIQEIKSSGATVKKGEVLVKFDREGIDRNLVDQRRAAELQTLALASRELAFGKLEEENKLALEAAQRAARTAAEDLENFTKVDLKAAQDQAKEALELAQQRLDAEREKLNQLKKSPPPQTTGAVEEAAEVLLKRQQAALKAAELDSHAAEGSARHTLEITLPRQQETLQTADRNAKLVLEKATQDLPRKLQTAKLELDGAKTALEREKGDLAKLESDAKLITLTAPADGVFYHGAMEDGRWIPPGEGPRALTKGSKIPLIRPFATLVAGQPALDLEAVVDEGVARSLTKGLKGNATAGGREDLAFTATVKSITGLPGGDGRYRVQIDTEWDGHKPGEFPADLEAAAGMTMECRFLVHQSDAAVVLPLKALRVGSDGTWTVEVKLADGKTEARPVKRGRVSGESVEIISGVEAGQVVTFHD